MSSPEVLLVEDNPSDVELARHAFARNNLAAVLHVARDGVEALEFLFATGPHACRAGRRPPRLVLLDLKLPRLDGLEVLRRVKADPRTRSIPVVMLSTSCEDRDVDASYGLGVNSYVVKPVDFEQFMRAVAILGTYWLVLNEAPTDAPVVGPP